MHSSIDKICFERPISLLRYQLPQWEINTLQNILYQFPLYLGGNPEDLGTIDGINQWEVISQNQTTKRNEILLNIEDEEKFSGILGYGGQYKLLNGKHLLCLT